MYALRKWMFKPKKSDASILAQFFHADEALNHVAAELDSFDGRKDPERCTALVNKLRHCQDKVLVVVEKIIQQVVPEERESRDFRVKFPDDVLQESLAGQLWFGAECLAAGSSIMNREVESASMRPLAKSLTRQLDHLRTLLRDQCLRSQSDFTDKIKEALLVFDKLFAEFELGYVSAMVPVKTMKEYDMLQEVTVLFCETVQRALQLHLLSQEMIDYYDPALMFTIPRLAIICGLLIYPEGPINPDKDPMNMSEMFRPFQMLLYKIRELLWTLSRNELWLLEKALSSTDDNLPLTDKAFEEQLNRLNILEQKRHSATVHCNKNNAGHSALDEPDQGIMSHSPSTQTVVTISSHGDGEACSDKHEPGEPTQDQLLHVRKQRVPHQESCDSGTLSMSDQVGSEAACKLMAVDEARGTTRTLHKSQSWPERKRSRSSSKNARCQRQSCSGDCQEFLSSVELLDECQGDENVQRVTCTQSMGSREFCFHLPHNTSLQEAIPSRCAINPNAPATESVQGEGQNQSLEIDDNGRAQQIMYTQNGCDQTDKDRDDASIDGRPEIHPHIAFITGALNNVFLMDPEFQGVAPPVIYDPPIPQLSPGTSARGKGHANKSRKRLSGKPKRKSKYCDTNTCVSEPGDSQVQGRVLCNTRENRHQSTHHCANEPKVQTSVRGGNPNLKVLKYADVVSAVPGTVEDVGDLSSSPGSCDEWDRESYCSSDTSSYASESHDDEEIALAIHAAEMAARKDARARYKTSSELIHKLFVCISGVADQLQTNYASDFRHILKSVFECHSSAPDIEPELESCKDKMAGSSVALQSQSSTDSSSHSSQEADGHHSNTNSRESGEQPTPSSSPSRQRVDPAEAAEPPPDWIPDEESPQCNGCEVPFSFVRRRHHCRNCGKIFCGRCSSNNVPLPHYGHCKPVRVCNHCFMFQVTPFTA